jgi:dihydrofolate reductase
LHGGWQAPYVDDVMGRLVTEGFADADGFLLGRKTYDIFANYWPKVTDPNNPIATALTLAAKVRGVAQLRACHLEQLQPDQGRCGRRDPEAPAAARPDRAHLGSTDVLQTLLKNDLIDGYRLFIFPVVLGSGKRPFGRGTLPVALKQVESVTTGKGGTYHRFRARREAGVRADRDLRSHPRRPAHAGRKALQRLAVW